MSKRENDTAFEGPPSKLQKEDMDDGGGGRIGRVRKKSAKLLEMEEFEQAEKTHSVVKKGKPAKGLTIFPPILSEVPESAPEGDSPVLSAKKGKAAKALSAGLVPVLPQGESKPEPDVSHQITSVDNNLSAATLTNLMVSSMSGAKHESAPEITSDSGQIATPVRGDDQKSVIKYLLSSPSAGSKLSVSSNTLTTLSPALVRPPVEASATPVVGKKSVKKPKSQEKSISKTHLHKEKKVKTEALSPASDAVVSSPSEFPKLKVSAPSLKMKILSSSDPSTAQVSLNPQSGPEGSKPKKLTKKIKQVSASGKAPDSINITSGAEVERPVFGEIQIPKKPGPKKGFKKKEKLIQDAISAAQQTPNFAPLASSQGTLSSQSSQIGLTSPTTKKAMQKSQKKKTKAALPSPASETPGSIPMREEDILCDNVEEESQLVIAGIEKEKKKTVSKKKNFSPKDKALSDSKLEKAPKKLPKRAPTAYMLFCNTHRPTIVSDNPGIEFAGISRKLGEMWQTLSNKQKLQWRRKAQRRMKKGSNLISTGKGGKETSTAAGSAAVALPQSSQGLKLSILQKSPRSGSEDTPQSPTKNFSIEPIDVAAHLKLLGESLSIIGMRLQEHKGMIAVQGSLSVLLDSLLCSCGPLLCLTQQIPGMDGCSPLVHAKTLDSVAYVMPGL